LNADGKIDALDQDWLGTILPAFEYGIRIDVAYNNFDLSIFGSGISGRTGTDPYGTLSYRIDVRNNNANNGILNAWSPTNTSSTVPRLSLVDANSENRASDFFIVNTSYFKMRTIQLGYTLPTAISQRIKMQSLRVYVMGDNLFWFRSNELTANDPELTSINLIPVPTAYTLGLNVTF
jgi:hypothetical protein